MSKLDKNAALANDIAETLYDWMANLTTIKLKHPNTSGWIQTPRNFLPDNVTLDFRGQRKFMRQMRDIIEERIGKMGGVQ